MESSTGHVSGQPTRLRKDLGEEIAAEVSPVTGVIPSVSVVVVA